MLSGVGGAGAAHAPICEDITQSQATTIAIAQFIAASCIATQRSGQQKPYNVNMLYTRLVLGQGLTDTGLWSRKNRDSTPRASCRWFQKRYLRRWSDPTGEASGRDAEMA